MRTMIILCLALVIALSFGCSKKKEEPAKTNPTQEEVSKAGKVGSMIDMVSKEEVDVETSPYSYEYNGVIYYFVSAENMEMFKADPEKYITPAETPPQTQ